MFSKIAVSDKKIELFLQATACILNGEVCYKFIIIITVLYIHVSV